MIINVITGSLSPNTEDEGDDILVEKKRKKFTVIAELDECSTSRKLRYKSKVRSHPKKLIYNIK